MNEQNIKAIFFDIDGTILPRNHTKIPASTVDSLNQLRQNNVKLFIATGRYKKAISFLDDSFIFDGYVTSNGQLCYLPNGKVVREQTLPHSTILKLVNLLNKTPLPVQFVGKNGIYANFFTKELIDRFTSINHPLPKENTAHLALQDEIYQCVAFTENFRQEILEQALLDAQLLTSIPYCLDIISNNSGKDYGIDAFIGNYGIKLSECMAFGDGDNDITMVKHAGVGVAMANASDNLKAIANYVTDYCDNDGITKALKHFDVL